MSDPVGTVRCSPEGIVAVYRGPQEFRGDWGASAEVDGFFDISDKRVADWEVVYTPPPPPHPVGTVLRYGDDGWWNVAIKTTDGWLWVDKMGVYAESTEREPSTLKPTSPPRPVVQATGARWEVLYGPVVGARAD